MHGGWYCLLRLSSGWCPADTGDAQEAFDAAEAEIVGNGEVAGGGSGAVGAGYGSDHVVGEPFAKAPQCRGGSIRPVAAGSVWPRERKLAGQRLAPSASKR
jgi:hypothetical protein